MNVMDTLFVDYENTDAVVEELNSIHDQLDDPGRKFLKDEVLDVLTRLKREQSVYDSPLISLFLLLPHFGTFINEFDFVTGDPTDVVDVGGWGALYRRPESCPEGVFCLEKFWSYMWALSILGVLTLLVMLKKY